MKEKRPGSSDSGLKHLKYDRAQNRRISDYPSHLRGMATNRFGGSNLQREEGFRGNTYGPAGAVTVYNETERLEYENQLRLRGDLQ